MNHKAYSDFLKSFGLQPTQVPALLPGIDMEAFSAKAREVDWGKETDLQGLLNACDANSTNILMQGLSEGITKRISDHGFPNHIKTFTGVFPTNSFNAQAVRFEDGALILIDTGCFTLLEAMTMLWAWDADHEASIALACRIAADYVSDYALPKEYEYDHQSLHDGTRLMAYSMLLTKAEELVLAHEHAHGALGHLWKAPLKRFSSPAGEVDLITKSMEEEIEADRLGLHLMFPAHDRTDKLEVRQISAAPYIVFGTAWLLENTLEAIHPKHPRVDTHPPALQRLALAEQQILAWGFDESLLDLGQRFLSWIDQCVKFVKRAKKVDLHAKVHKLRHPPLIGLSKMARAPNVGVYVRTSVLTAKYDSHEKQLLEYCSQQGWRKISVYADRKGGNIPTDKLDVLLKGRREGAFKPGGFELFFGLLNGARMNRKGSGNVDNEFAGRAELISDARSGKLDIVIAQDLGRLATNKLGVFHVVRTLQGLGLTVIVPHLGVLNDQTKYPAGLDYD
jgi:hypothetical protein